MAVTQSTFLDKYVSTENANEYGHTHLFEVSIRMWSLTLRIVSIFLEKCFTLWPLKLQCIQDLLFFVSRLPWWTPIHCISVDNCTSRSIQEQEHMPHPLLCSLLTKGELHILKITFSSKTFCLKKVDYIKVDGPWSNSGLNWTPRFEWYVFRCGSKNGHQKLHVFRRDWTTCSKYANFSMLNSKHKHKLGGIYMTTWWESSLW